MPRNGSGVYSLPAGSLVTDNVDDILASQHNTPLTDLQTDMNTVRPIVAGGTGASSASGARTALGLGTLATQNEGTAADEFRDNAANEAFFAPLSAASALSGSFKAMNGDFSVNQGGTTSGSAKSSTFYPPIYVGVAQPPDRFFPIVTIGTGGTWALTANTAAIGHLLPSRYFTFTCSSQSAAGDFGFVMHRIESARTYAGASFTLFQWLKRATAGNIAVSIRQHFGTGGSPSADVTTYIGQLTLTTSFAPYRLVVAVPSVAGKTFGTNNNDYLEIVYWASAGSTYNTTTGSLGLANTTVDFYGIHERVGDVPIEAINYYQPPDPQIELARCMRYYQNLTQVGRVSGAAPSIGQIAFPVAMRATPAETITYNTGSGATWAVSRTGMVQTSNHSGNASVTQLILDAEL